MAVARANPFVWITWISKLLSGETHCLWSAWFRAHYTYTKLPNYFDLQAWQYRHTALIHEQVERLRADGWTVYIEKQNGFRLTNPANVTLAGVPSRCS